MGFQHWSRASGLHTLSLCHFYGFENLWHFSLHNLLLLLVWLSPVVIMAHTSPGWAPCHPPPGSATSRRARARSTPARSSFKCSKKKGQASNEEKNKMQLSAIRGNRTWNLLLVLSMANHYATLMYIFCSIRLFNSLYYLATRQLWTMYISNVVNSYKIFCQNYTSIKRLYVLNMNFIQFFESIQVAHVVQIGISFYKHT